MRITFWAIIFSVSLLASLGQAVYVIYFVGDQVGEYALVENGQPNATDPFEITQDELPVRLNILLYGNRDIIGGNGDSIASILDAANSRYQPAALLRTTPNYSSFQPMKTMTSLGSP